MNLTLHTLISHSLSFSPFLTTNKQSHFQHSIIHHCRFTKYFSSFLYGIESVSSNNSILHSSFTNFLSSPIYIQKSTFKFSNIFDSIYSFAFTKNPIYLNSSQSRWHTEYSQPRTIYIFGCFFSKCKSREGGAIHTEQSNVTIDSSRFIANAAKNSGAVSLADGPSGIIKNSLFQSNSAKRFGALHLDGHDNTNFGQIVLSNFTNNFAKVWIGCLRIQHNHGDITDCIFHKSHSQEFGAIWDYSHLPGKRHWVRDCILNNTADIGSGITIYHLNHVGFMNNCIFQNNINGKYKRGNSIYLYSDNDHITLNNCIFDGSIDSQILVYFSDSSSVEGIDSNFFMQNISYTCYIDYINA